MNFSQALRQLLDARPNLTLDEIVEATGWDRRQTQTIIYNLQESGELQVLPKRFALTESFAERARKLEAKKAATYARALKENNKRRRAKTAARRAERGNARAPQDLEAYRPSETPEQIVALAKRDQHPLAMAWR